MSVIFILSEGEEEEEDDDDMSTTTNRRSKIPWRVCTSICTAAHRLFIQSLSSKTFYPLHPSTGVLVLPVFWWLLHGLPDAVL